MSIAVVSLLALILALVLSMGSRINVGLIALALAWLIGVYLADLPVGTVLSGFPTSLFLTLAGVTLLFGIADTNGTLETLAHHAMALIRGNPLAMPVLFFFIACLLSAAGPGAISSTALIIPVAMSVGSRLQLPPLLVSLMVANGANAGNLSPISTVGIIANSRMDIAGISDEAFKVFFANFIAHLLVAGAAYLVFYLKYRQPASSLHLDITAAAPMDKPQKMTTVVIAAWIAAVIFLELHVGLSAFAAACILLICRTADESKVIARMPWPVMLMVGGVATLIALLDETGGMELFTNLLSALSTSDSIYGVIAFITGAISAYSSTSGVVMPAFLPTIPSLVENLGGGDPLAIALSINVGSSLVDVSPISTIGAICLATISDPERSRKVFIQLMAWGLGMTLAGGVFCQLFARLIAGL
jgi:di/tricarboxylate transporter